MTAEPAPIRLGLTLVAEPSPPDSRLVYLAYVWGDIESVLERAAGGYLDPIPEEAMFVGHPDADKAATWAEVWDAVRTAIRVEVRRESDGGTPYVFVFDNGSDEAKNAKRKLDSLHTLLGSVIFGWPGEISGAWRFRTELLPRDAPPRGVVCRRDGERDPPPPTARKAPPKSRRTGGVYGLQEHDGYLFDSPAAVLFYDALKDSDLIFVHEPTVQHRHQRPRPDFLVLVGGRAVRVEIDGYEFHAKTREQHTRDVEKDHWYDRRGVRTIRFTGRQVNADPAGCVRELIEVLRGREAYPSDD